MAVGDNGDSEGRTEVSVDRKEYAGGDWGKEEKREDGREKHKRSRRRDERAGREKAGG